MRDFTILIDDQYVLVTLLSITFTSSAFLFINGNNEKTCFIDVSIYSLFFVLK